MWTTPAVVLALCLAAAQDKPLSIVNDAFTYGPNGPIRPDSKYLPGDVLFVDFDIEGLKYDADAKGSYSVAMEVTDAKGGSVLKQQGKAQPVLNYFGGDVLPGLAHLQIGMEQPAGMYTIKLTVTDQSAKQSKSMEKKFEVLPAGFGLVQVGMSSDPEGAVPEAPLGLVGETNFINFSAVGFARDKSTKQPNLKVEMRVLDDQGQPTCPKPLTGEAQSGISEALKLVPMQFALTMNRAGKFTVEIKATDVLGNKTATVRLPITVVTLK
jgi:hypothetical protein